MNVIKRNNEIEEVSFDKVLTRIRLLCQDINVNYYDIAQKVCGRIYNNVKTSELDELAANICSSMIAENPAYAILAARISISNHHKNTSPSFSETIFMLYNNKDVSLISPALYDTVMKNKEKLNNYIDYQRDYSFDYFGFKTLERSYLMKIKGKIVERPQHMFMRVSLGIHGNDIKDALQTYDLMSKKYFTHATPTLFNAGTPKPQLSSCFLLSVDGDSIDKIFDTVKECAMISKYAGGIGIHVHDVRAKGSIIRGTNGISDGVVPMLKVLNQTARYVNQCFTPDTIVYTKEGPKRMDAISTEDSLVTHDGSFKKVLGVAIKSVSNEEILNIKTEFSLDSIRVTKQHEIYVKECEKSPPKFILAKDLDVNSSLIGFSIPTYIQDYEKYNEDFCRLYGIFIGGGHHWECDQNGMNYLRIDNDLLSEDTTDFLWKYFKDKKYDDIVYDKYFVRQWIDDTFKEFDYREAIKKEFLHLPRNKSFNMLKGILEANNGLELSHDLAMAVRYISLRLGIMTTSDGKKNGKYDISPIYPPDLLLEDGIIWTKISSIKSELYSGLVYDFNMMDNHNYTVANMGLVHNSGKRNGSIAVYLEPWHADIFEFIELKKPHGNEEDRARDLFYALWIPDLFMERVKTNQKWSLMCPNKCKGLSDVYGDEFKKIYEEYESLGLYNKQIDAQQLWFKILESQIESGGPYMLFKDACNKKSNQKNLGTIKSSNLCTEIVEYSSPDETGTCNLSSICLPTFIEIDSDTKKPFFNFEKLHQVAMTITKNLNKVIDINYYPVEKARRSNFRHRPIGIGIQGLADTYVIMRYAFDSEEAKKLNIQIFETIYHGSVEQSMLIAKTRHNTIKDMLMNEMNYDESKTSYLNMNEYDPPSKSKYPGAYSSFEGSPTSYGKLQFDLWDDFKPSNDRYDWDALKQEIQKYGLRNSLLVAPMPTASTSQIMGFNEAFEAFTSNIYKRKTLAGEFVVVNKYLIQDLIDLNLWNSDMKNMIILNEGSIQNIASIPEEIRNLYKTVWEMKQKSIIDQAVDRGPFICQSQSMNLFVEAPSFKTLSSMHFYTWSRGLKTCSYYIRSKPKAKNQQFTIDPAFKKAAEEEKKKNVICTDEVCTLCSS
jgi:ribonucleotide reductase alpha subunit